MRIVGERKEETIPIERTFDTHSNDLRIDHCFTVGFGWIGLGLSSLVVSGRWTKDVFLSIDSKSEAVAGSEEATKFDLVVRANFEN